MDEKIKYHSCVGCGYCCRKAPCSVAMRIFGNSIKECPALMWDGSKYFCELCKKDGYLGEKYRKELYIGEGCCSPLNSDRDNIPAPKKK